MYSYRGVTTFVCAAILLAGCSQGTQTSPAGGDWLSFNGGPLGVRYSSLNEITSANVNRLKPVCRLKLAQGGTFQAGPVVRNGIMYLTLKNDTIALDATNCAVKWRQVYQPLGPEPFNTNHGVALDGNVLFRGFLDGRLSAIDATTGKTLWSVVVADSRKGEFLSATPVVANGFVYMGIAGADWGAKGRMMAFDEKTGKQVWRFDLIPTGNEFGADTWKNPRSTATGGGSTWTTYTLDAADGTIYLPVGNPAPDFSPRYRPGDNLFTDSIVGLDMKTGALKWYHQFVKNDSHDWDVGAAPAVVTTRAAYVCPAWLGGVEWNGPAFDKPLNEIVVNSVKYCGTYKLGEVRFVGGSFFLGGSIQLEPASAGYGWTTALDADTGKVIWRIKQPTPMIAAVTPTAGGVIFTGDMAGKFQALDATTGKMLYSDQTHGTMAGGVVTYEVNGRQYVAADSGNVSRSLWTAASGSPTINIYAL